LIKISWSIASIKGFDKSENLEVISMYLRFLGFGQTTISGILHNF